MDVIDLFWIGVVVGVVATILTTILLVTVLVRLQGPIELSRPEPKEPK